MRLYLILLTIITAHLIHAQTSVVVLGTTQDAGSPQLGCTKEYCKNLFTKPDQTRKVVSLGLYDPNKKISYLFEATPDIGKQLRLLKAYSRTTTDLPNGIFLTHAHIGHYTGLMYLGKEALNTKELPVYSMPKMKSFLEQNGPWSQNINTIITKVDYALIDATFYNSAEVNNRAISEIPHPLVIESLEKFKYLPKEEKKKIYFIHFNHTNPLLQEQNKITKKVLNTGFNIARMGNIFKL